MVEEKKEKKVQVGDRLEGANINSEKKRQLDDPLPGDRLDGEGVSEKDKNKRRTLMLNLLAKIWKDIAKDLSALLRLIVILVALLVLFSRDFISADSMQLVISSFWELFSNYSNFLAIIVGIISIFLAIFGLRQITTRSSYEISKQELSTRFSIEEKELTLQIETAKNDVEKMKLKHQILELGNKYQILSGKILQKEDGSYVEDWRSVLLSARKRLLDEEDRLLTRNRRNLGIAMVMIAVGIIFLISSARVVVGDPEINNVWAFLVKYGPISSVIILIEVPTFFFLSLYSQTARMLERNKNELTNIELRLTSGLLLSHKTGVKKFDSLADDLAKEERNFILAKNESSAVLETDKLLELLSKIPKIGT